MRAYTRVFVVMRIAFIGTLTCVLANSPVLIPRCSLIRNADATGTGKLVEFNSPTDLFLEQMSDIFSLDHAVCREGAYWQHMLNLFAIKHFVPSQCPLQIDVYHNDKYRRFVVFMQSRFGLALGYLSVSLCLVAMTWVERHYDAPTKDTRKPVQREPTLLMERLDTGSTQED